MRYNPDLGACAPGCFVKDLFRRSCCKSSKVLQIPVILHFHSRATTFGTCCLRRTCSWEVRAQRCWKARFRHHSNTENMRKLEALFCGVRSKTGKHHETLGFHDVFAIGHRIIGICSTWYRIRIVVAFCCVSVESSGVSCVDA